MSGLWRQGRSVWSVARRLPQRLCLLQVLLARMLSLQSYLNTSGVLQSPEEGQTTEAHFPGILACT